MAQERFLIVFVSAKAWVPPDGTIVKVAVFDTHKFDRTALEIANDHRHELHFLEVRLTETTAILAQDCEAVCCFANDQANARALKKLKDIGVRLVALRSAGYNHVDLKAAAELDLTVVRVPEYSPYAVAEFAVGLLLTLNRKIHKAHARVHEMNFSLDGLVGFDLHGKTVGVLGTGKIGKVFARIMKGFGCHVLAYDAHPDKDWAKEICVTYVELNQLLTESDVVSLHVPLTLQTRHIIDAKALSLMKKEAFLINTGRGALIETSALLSSLKQHALAGACLDVYEEEEGIFFADLSEDGINDDQLARLLTFPNVLVTSHQAFLTKEALKNIADTTISSISKFEKSLDLSDVLVRYRPLAQ